MAEWLDYPALVTNGYPSSVITIPIGSIAFNAQVTALPQNSDILVDRNVYSFTALIRNFNLNVLQVQNNDNINKEIISILFGSNPVKTGIPHLAAVLIRFGCSKFAQYWG